MKTLVILRSMKDFFVMKYQSKCVHVHLELRPSLNSRMQPALLMPILSHLLPRHVHHAGVLHR